MRAVLAAAVAVLGSAAPASAGNYEVVAFASAPGGVNNSWAAQVTHESARAVGVPDGH